MCSIDLDELSTDLANSRKSDELSGKPVTAPSIEVCLAGIHGQDAAKTAIPHRSQDFTGAADGIEDDLAALASYTQPNFVVARAVDANAHSPDAVVSFDARASFDHPHIGRKLSACCVACTCPRALRCSACARRPPDPYLACTVARSWSPQSDRGRVTAWRLAIEGADLDSDSTQPISNC